MDLKELQRHWDGFGATDPLFAILTEHTKRGGRWDQDEFFAWGERDISFTMEKLRHSGVAVKAGIALDFGCGVGRLTQALAQRFQSVWGVDIAPSMIAEAKRLSRSERCHYLVNGRDNLLIFPSGFFDFIYTHIVLQHMEPRYSTKYIEEFLRILRPGGVLVFDLPDRLKPCKKPTRKDDSAYNAQIRILSAPAEVGSGENFEILADVRNASRHLWPGEHRAAEGFFVRLGNHWLTANGETEVRDDGRTGLPHDLEPGAEVELTLEVRAPERSGSFVLELDLVQEGVGWFSNVGSVTARQSIVVKPAAKNFGQATRGDENFRREMYSVPRAEVEQIIAMGGGHLVHAYDSISSGPEWIAYEYVVTK